VPVRHGEKKVRLTAGCDPDDLANRLLGLLITGKLLQYGVA
jgi:hypothetical protein